MQNRFDRFPPSNKHCCVRLAALEPSGEFIGLEAEPYSGEVNQTESQSDPIRRIRGTLGNRKLIHLVEVLIYRQFRCVSEVDDKSNCTLALFADGWLFPVGYVWEDASYYHIPRAA